MKTITDAKITYALRQGDTPLILAQRLCAWCGHAPELEIDLALANIGLDLLGQARNFLGYAAQLAGPSYSEDRLAFGRDEREFRNLLLAEQPNGGFNDTLVRQFLLDAYHVLLHRELSHSKDSQLAAIAAKSLKEAEYHLRFSRGWMIRLGDGNEVSHQKIQQSLNDLWRFTAELFHADAIELELAEQGIAVDPRQLQAPWQEMVNGTLQQATLALPAEPAFRHGGKQGQHSEHLGLMLAEMQFLQRAYPNCNW
ncbi:MULTISPECIES: 1,2-phenylacetyl-CoA epoxidase subunit PaaC [unclassified Serratia (in: enterobacteria)]|uniref:1,2-phenylacetyl-CoA epoxidase subunit PaaC n=1 Tax=unclassified Serratia (in: enterobacteria) TaxID=2647522 RepID=UPI003075F34B